MYPDPPPVIPVPDTGVAGVTSLPSPRSLGEPRPNRLSSVPGSASGPKCFQVLGLSPTLSLSVGTWYLVVVYRGNGGIRRGIYQLQGDDNGHVGRPREVSPARPCPELLCELRGLCRRSYPGPRTCGRSEKPISWGGGVSIRVSKETFLPLNVQPVFSF